MLAGLALGLGLGLRRSSSGLPEGDIEILDEPSASEKIDLGRRFGTALCVSGRTSSDAAPARSMCRSARTMYSTWASR